MMQHRSWAGVDLVSDRLDVLRGTVGWRVDIIERYTLAAYTEAYELRSEKTFECTEGVIVFSFLDSPATLEFWGHESAQAIGVSLFGSPGEPASTGSKSARTDEELVCVATSDDFPLWVRVKGRAIESSGIINWDRGDSEVAGTKSAGAYFRLGGDLEILVAHQLVSQGQDLLRSASLAGHLRDRLSYLPSG